MASKRISMKGRGADLFFGDYTPPDSAGIDVVEPIDLEAIAADSPPPPPADEVVASIASQPVVIADFLTLASAASQGKDETESTTASPPSIKQSSKRASTLTGKRASGQAGKRDIVEASTRESRHASTLVVSADTIEALRRAVREPGREVAYVRLTPEEKGQVSDIVYDYKKRGQRTTENELHRIAINHLLHDYHEYGAESVLAHVLARLLA